MSQAPHSSDLPRAATHSCWFLCPSIYLCGHFSSLQHVQGRTPTGVFRGDVDHRQIPVWASASTFCSKLIEIARMIAWATASTSIITSWSSDCIGCTIFTDVCLLDSEDRCSQILSSRFMLMGWGSGWGGWSSEESQKEGCIRSLCKHVNSMYKSVFETELVKRFHTLAGSCEQCRRGVRFHPGPTGIVLCLPVWL